MSRLLTTLRRRNLKSPLLKDLVSYWKLDEASGTRFDSHGANHLTDTNTVSQAVGKLDNAAAFVRANFERLDIASNADLTTGAIDWSFACWFFPTNTVDYQGIAAKKTDNAQQEWELAVNGTNLQWYVVHEGNASSDNILLGGYTANAWNHIMIWKTGTTIGMQLNGGTPSTLTLTATPRTSTGMFALGATGGGNFYDGRIDEAGFWRRALSADERTTLYSNGAGKGYPF